MTTSCLSNQNSTCVCKLNPALAPTTTEGNGESNDDVWAMDDDESNHNGTEDSRKLAYNDIIRQHRKQGYVDGITAHREDQLQRGFDDAFPQGAQLGIEVGKILAHLRCQQGREDKRGEGGDNFKRAINDLLISKVLDRQYFNNDLEPLPTHDLIEKWKHHQRQSSS